MNLECFIEGHKLKRLNENTFSILWKWDDVHPIYCILHLDGKPIEIRKSLSLLSRDDSFKIVWEVTKYDLDDNRRNREPRSTDNQRVIKD
jgi:hypothetical protein